MPDDSVAHGAQMPGNNSSQGTEIYAAISSQIWRIPGCAFFAIILFWAADECLRQGILAKGLILAVSAALMLYFAALYVLSLIYIRKPVFAFFPSSVSVRRSWWSRAENILYRDIKNVQIRTGGTPMVPSFALVIVAQDRRLMVGISRATKPKEQIVAMFIAKAAAAGITIPIVPYELTRADIIGF